MFSHLSVIVFTEGVSLSRGLSVQGVSVQSGVSIQEGLCPEGGLCQGDPLYGKERAVRILLECILVFKLFLKVVLLVTAL